MYSVMAPYYTVYKDGIPTINTWICFKSLLQQLLLTRCQTYRQSELSSHSACHCMGYCAPLHDGTDKDGRG